MKKECPAAGCQKHPHLFCWHCNPTDSFTLDTLNYQSDGVLALNILSHTFFSNQKQYISLHPQPSPTLAKAST